ncbi:MAG: hypothetical protein ACNA76_03065 [Anaerosomatales bacterium]
MRTSKAVQFELLDIVNETIPWMVPAVAAVIIGAAVWIMLKARRRCSRAEA